jgi:hypothetical protein
MKTTRKMEKFSVDGYAAIVFRLHAASFAAAKYTYPNAFNAGVVLVYLPSVCCPI